MKIENNIGWCDATTNAVTGCDKVSPGCRFCYAESGTRARVLRAQGKETWGAKGERVPVNFAPVFRRLNKLCVCDKCHTTAGFDFVGSECIYQPNHTKGDATTCDGEFRRIRLFADSNSDWLDPKWPVETLAQFLDATRLAPNVDTLLLTKRIEQWKRTEADLLDFCHETDRAELFGWLMHWRKNPPSHLWIGVSVEDQKRADERIPLLLQTPAAVRFLSIEPLLEKVDLRLDDAWVQFANQKTWAIVGGESGKNRRDCGVDAISSIILQCATARVPVFCKQDAALLPGQKGRLSDHAWSYKEFPR